MEFLQPQIDQGVLRGSSADITSNLTAHLLFNDDATDSSGNSNDFTAQGSPTYATGKKGNAIDLERSSSQYVERASFGPSGSFTVSCWVKPESLPTNASHYIASREGDEGGRQFEIYYLNFLGSSTLVFRVRVDPGTIRSANISSPDMTVGEWSHVAFVYDADGETVKTYLDYSGQTAEDSASGELDSATSPFKIGASVGNTGTWDGLIDEFRYYEGRALTAADVATLYGGGTPP